MSESKIEVSKKGFYLLSLFVITVCIGLLFWGGSWLYTSGTIGGSNNPSSYEPFFPYDSELGQTRLSVLENDKGRIVYRINAVQPILKEIQIDGDSIIYVGRYHDGNDWVETAFRINSSVENSLGFESGDVPKFNPTLVTYSYSDDKGIQYINTLDGVESKEMFQADTQYRLEYISHVENVELLNVICQNNVEQYTDCQKLLASITYGEYSDSTLDIADGMYISQVYDDLIVKQ